MTINVSEALDCDTAERIQRIRYGADSVLAGDVVRSPGVTTFALASVQQPTERQMKHLEHAERSEDYRLFICNVDLRTADERDEARADVVVYRDMRFKIVKPKDWMAFGHSTSVGIRLDE